MCSLEDLGIESYEPFVCADTVKNRGILTRNEVEFEILSPGVISVDRTQLQALPTPGQDATFDRDVGTNLSHLGAINLTYRLILKDPEDPYSDYVDFMELPLEYMELHAQPWVKKRYDKILRARETGGDQKSDSATLIPPVRCKGIRVDGQRCLAWSMPTPLSTEYCRAHMDRKAMSSNDYHAEKREAIQERLMQLIEPAVAALEDIVINGGAPQVRLKAAETILDRTGFKPGTDHNVKVEVEHKLDDPAMLIRQRLEKLASSLAPQEIEAAPEPDEDEDDEGICEAEIVE